MQFMITLALIECVNSADYKSDNLLQAVSHRLNITHYTVIHRIVHCSHFTRYEYKLQVTNKLGYPIFPITDYLVRHYISQMYEWQVVDYNKLRITCRLNFRTDYTGTHERNILA